MDNQLVHEIVIPESFRRPLEAARALITSKRSFKPVGHLRVAGCKTRVAIAKEIAPEGLSIIVCGTQTLPKAMKGYCWQLHLFQTISRPMKQALCQGAWRYT